MPLPPAPGTPGTHATLPAAFGASADAFLASLKPARPSRIGPSAVPTPPAANSRSVAFGASADAFLASLRERAAPVPMPTNPIGFRVSDATFLAATSSSPCPAPASSAPASSAPSTSANPSTGPSLPANGFYFDIANGYNLSFDSPAHFKTWLSEHRRNNSVEFRHRQTEKTTQEPDKRTWLTRSTYSCARDGDSRATERPRKKPDRNRKAFLKELEEGCSAKVTVKTYPGTDRVLAKLRDTHSHPVGAENLPYMTLSKDMLREIERQVAQGKSRKNIHNSLHDSALESSHVGVLSVLDRDKQVKLEDIGRIERRLRAEKFLLHPDDDLSVLEHVKRIRAAGGTAVIKTRRDAAPADSGLDDDAFVLVFQTRYQRECWYYYAHDRLSCIDATHNTTEYESLSLFTIVARDDWGHGTPVAFMVSSKATEATIRFFLKTVKSWAPVVVPREWMSDRDPGQINAILEIFATAILLLCRWHVLHAWYQHFNVREFSVLWELLKNLVYAPTKAQFDDFWHQLKALGPDQCPPSVVEYLEEYWMTEYWLPKWATYARTGRSIFEESDTNMLVEAWHHLLKSFFGEGKRGRRLDELLHILTVDVERYTRARHQRQLAGAEGHNLEQAARLGVLQRAKDIAITDIIPPANIVSNSVYRVRSQSASAGASTFYDIDTSALPPACSCLAYPRLRFCKHIAAVGICFPNAAIDISIYPPTARTSLHPQLQIPDVHATVAASAPGIPLPLRAIKPLSEVETAASTQLARDLISLADDLTTNPRPISAINPLRTAVSKLKTPQSELLPPKEKVGPNQKTGWKETAKNMGARVSGIGERKGGKKRVHTDPYSANERPGKKARSDAHIAGPPRGSSPSPTPLPAPLSAVPDFEPVPSPPAEISLLDELYDGTWTSHFL